MGEGVSRELIAQFFRADDCQLSVKMVLGSQPAALFRLVAEVWQQARAEALEDAAKEVKAWFPCGTIDKPEFAAGKALRGIIGKRLTYGGPVATE